MIHVDRMRLKNSQLLVGENDGNYQKDAKQSIDGDKYISLVESDKFNQSSPKNDTRPELEKGADLPARQFRSRRQPIWMKDYEVDF